MVLRHLNIYIFQYFEMFLTAVSPRRLNVFRSLFRRNAFNPGTIDRKKLQIFFCIFLEAYILRCTCFVLWVGFFQAAFYKRILSE